MMESGSILFNKSLLVVAILAKQFQFITRLIFKSIWFLSFDFKVTKSTTGHIFREFSWKNPMKEITDLSVK